jgi:hypothetical protein
VNTMKPSNFFIAVTDFFSILLPGSAIAFIVRFLALELRSYVPGNHILYGFLYLNGIEAWVAFGFTSYVFGHMIGILAARMDQLYDISKIHHSDKTLLKCANKILLESMKECLENGEEKPSTAGPTSLFAKYVNKLLIGNSWKWRATRDNSVSTLFPIDAPTVASMTLNHLAPRVFAEVAQLEADARFFRSLVAVAVIGVPFELVFIICDGIRGLSYSSISGLSYSSHFSGILWSLGYLVFLVFMLNVLFARFCGLRLRSSEIALQGLIVFGTTRPNEQIGRPTPRSDDDYVEQAASG